MEFTLMDDFKFLTQERLNIFCDLSLGSLCRLCLVKTDLGAKFYDIFADPATPNMIMSCASVQISEADGLPTGICQNCLEKLNTAWQFKLLCENSDAKLREIFLGSSIATIGMVSETGLSGAVELEEVAKTVEYQMSIPEEGTNKQAETESEVKKDKQKHSKVHQCETCGKIFNRREYLTQHLRIHTGEKPYHCHLCEKRFINSGHLITHMRKHTGEKPHQCSLCTKAFSTKQELTKHTMVHKGERPFICTGCGKKFGSLSNLYTHMKHHTGVKTFICEHCSKSFYTKQELKQHQVIHTGEKAFLCEYCNKRFSQIAHLRRHLKLHSKDA